MYVCRVPQIDGVRKELERMKAEEAGLLERLGEESKVERGETERQAGTDYPLVVRCANVALVNFSSHALAFCLGLNHATTRFSPLAFVCFLFSVRGRSGLLER